MVVRLVGRVCQSVLRRGVVGKEGRRVGRIGPDRLSGSFSGPKICVGVRRGHSADHRTATRGWGGVRPEAGPAAERRRAPPSAAERRRDGVQLYHVYSQSPLFPWLSRKALGALWAQASQTPPPAGSVRRRSLA